MTTDVENIILGRLATLEAKVDAVATQLAEMRGGRKMLTLIAGTVGGAVGAAFAWWRHP